MQSLNLVPIVRVPDLRRAGPDVRHPGGGQLAVGDQQGIPVHHLPAQTGGLERLDVGLPHLLVLRHHPQHRGAHLPLREVSRLGLCLLMGGEGLRSPFIPPGDKRLRSSRGYFITSGSGVECDTPENKQKGLLAMGKECIACISRGFPVLKKSFGGKRI